MSLVFISGSNFVRGKTFVYVSRKEFEKRRNASLIIRHPIFLQDLDCLLSLRHLFCFFYFLSRLSMNLLAVLDINAHAGSSAMNFSFPSVIDPFG